MGKKEYLPPLITEQHIVDKVKEFMQVADKLEVTR